MKWHITSESELERVVTYVLEHVCSQVREKALVFGLYGNLGAGKTAFTKKLVHALGGTDTVTSPTFIIERIYQLKNNYNLDNLVHIDAYRFEAEQEAEVLHLDKKIKMQNTCLVIEWPELAGAHMPPHHTLIFTHDGGDTRTIEYISL